TTTSSRTTRFLPALHSTSDRRQTLEGRPGDGPPFFFARMSGSGAARGAAECLDLPQILDAGSTFEPRRGVNQRRTGQPDRLGNVVGREPAREAPWQFVPEAVEQRPVDREALPAGLFLRRGIVEQHVGGALV